MKYEAEALHEKRAAEATLDPLCLEPARGQAKRGPEPDARSAQSA